MRRVCALQTLRFLVWGSPKSRYPLRALKLKTCLSREPAQSLEDSHCEGHDAGVANCHGRLRRAEFEFKSEVGDGRGGD